MHRVETGTAAPALVQYADEVDDRVAIGHQLAERIGIVNISDEDIGRRQHADFAAGRRAAGRDPGEPAAISEPGTQMPPQKTRSAQYADSSLIRHDTRLRGDRKGPQGADYRPCAGRLEFQCPLPLADAPSAACRLGPCTGLSNSETRRVESVMRQ